MNGTRDEARERAELVRDMEKLAREHTAFGQSPAVIDAMVAAYALGELAGLELAAQWCDENDCEAVAAAIRALAADGGGDDV